MSFDSRKSIQRTADAESFTAKIVEGTNAVRADISYKPKFKMAHRQLRRARWMR
jgi:hypothetical protein